MAEPSSRKRHLWLGCLSGGHTPMAEPSSSLAERGTYGWAVYQVGIHQWLSHLAERGTMVGWAYTNG